MVKMANVTQILEVYPFGYNKILSGQRKIDIRLYSESLQRLRVGDMIEYVNAETHEHLTREVKGIALFDSFDTLINMLPAEMIGYQTKEEIRVRIERMYSKKDEYKYGVCALFLEEPSIKRMMKFNHYERSA